MPNVKNLANHRKAAPAAGPESFPTRNDLSASTRKKVIRLLDQLVADSSDLRSQVKHAHWNVKGPNFIGLHKMFDEFVEGLEDYIDVIAERATALGVRHPAARTLRMAAHAARHGAEVPRHGGRHRGRARVGGTLRRSVSRRSPSRPARPSPPPRRPTTRTTAGPARRRLRAALDKGLWFLEAHLEDGK